MGTGENQIGQSSAPSFAVAAVLPHLGASMRRAHRVHRRQCVLSSRCRGQRVRGMTPHQPCWVYVVLLLQKSCSDRAARAITSTPLTTLFRTHISPLNIVRDLLDAGVDTTSPSRTAGRASRGLVPGCRAPGQSCMMSELGRRGSTRPGRAV